MDEQIIKKAIWMSGIGASSFDYTLIWRNSESFDEAAKIAPGVLPIWTEFELDNLFVLNTVDDEDIPEFFRIGSNDYNSRFMQHNIDKVNYQNKELIRGNIVKTVKDYLENYGLTKRGWKYLLQINPRKSDLLIHYLRTPSCLCAFLDILAGSGGVPRWTLFKSLAHFFSSCGERIIDRGSLQSFFGELVKVGNKSKSIKRWVGDEVALIYDWIRSEGLRTDTNQRRAGWSWYWSQQRRWHDEQVVRQESRYSNTDYSWDSKVSEYKVGDYLVVPLENSQALMEEGTRMHHCVGSYARRCYDGTSRIFSIRNVEGHSLATLELSKKAFLATEKTGFSLTQVRGYSNAAVEKHITLLANDVEKRYNAALRKSNREKRKSCESAEILSTCH